MRHQIQDWPDQLSELADRVSNLDNMLARKDLNRMLNHAKMIWADLDNELIECRRLNRYTQHYHSLEQALGEQLRTVSKWLTWAHLRF